MTIKSDLKAMPIQTILIAVIFFFVFTSLWAVYTSVRPPRITSTITPKDLGLSHERVTFTTADNIELAGWFIPGSDPETKRTIILLHGYPADKGDILRPLSFLNEDFNLLLFDFRYLGESGGRYSTGGPKEVLDLMAAISFLKSRGIEVVGVWGFSMGGAVALMTQEKSQEIKAIVSEASYASLNDLAYELFRLPRPLKTPLVFFTGLWAKLIFGIDIRNDSPQIAIRKSSIPILIIHSKNDEVVPFNQALKLKDALSNNLHAEFWFEENLIHGMLGKGYEERIRNFFDKNL